ncbi:hypothetical protein QLQ12_46420 [Actinoplanes sp. NEAU-A12]|uniref:DUF4245 domain-containing protein n=1 Tax=Actinoplanes sandaracinus TaxID=3045177 RepID=A0ABT6X2E7_9ACTN|nr:hypothetical protein [Actinoplanes sandaracinus]MDI6106026.1 hypothetical protein [Actinoplanes sandaracinus]
MTDSHADELGTLFKEDFALPVTDAFIAGVHRGVRRRRTMRAVAGGGAVLATAGVAALVFTLVGPGGSAPLPAATGPIAAASSTPPSTVDPISELLDGYRVTFVPAGLEAGSPANGSATYPVSKDTLHNDGSAPATEHPTAAVADRMYVLPNGANWLNISVLRPERTTAGADREQVTEWLAGWALKGTKVTETYQLPAGRAQLAAAKGSEVTAHHVVITAPDGAVIIVGGNGNVPVADLKAVAAGLLPR